MLPVNAGCEYMLHYKTLYPLDRFLLDCVTRLSIMQTFLSTPNLSKSFLYKNPGNTYQRYCNAYAYNYLVHFGTPKNKENLVKECNLAWKEIKKSDAKDIEAEIKMLFNTTLLVTRSHWQHTTSSKMAVIQPTLEQPLPSTIELAPNAIGQKYATRNIAEAQKKREQCIQMINISNDPDIYHTLWKKLEEANNEIAEQKKRLAKLKRHAASQARVREKKARSLEEDIVEMYDKPGRPSAATIYPDLWDKIHDCVEFGAASAKRRKSVIKVRTIKHLKEELEKKHQIYLAR